MSSGCTRMWWKPFLISRVTSDPWARTWSQTVEILSYWNLGVSLMEFRCLRSMIRRNVLFFFGMHPIGETQCGRFKHSSRISLSTKAVCFSYNKWFGRTNPSGVLEKWRRTRDSIHSITGNRVSIVDLAFKWLRKFPARKVSFNKHRKTGACEMKNLRCWAEKMILAWKRMGKDYLVCEKEWNSWRALL